MLPGSVGVSGSLVLPCLDDRERVASDFLAEVTRNVPGTRLKLISEKQRNVMEENFVMS